MKFYTKLSIWVFALTFLVSCSEEKKVLTETKGDLTIEVSASKLVAGDPWTVVVELKIAGKDINAKAQRDIVASDISKENVAFEWADENTCLVKITETNGQIASIPVRVQR